MRSLRKIDLETLDCVLSEVEAGEGPEEPFARHGVDARLLENWPVKGSPSTRSAVPSPVPFSKNTPNSAGLVWPSGDFSWWQRPRRPRQACTCRSTRNQATPPCLGQVRGVTRAANLPRLIWIESRPLAQPHRTRMWTPTSDPLVSSRFCRYSIRVLEDRHRRERRPPARMARSFF